MSYKNQVFKIALNIIHFFVLKCLGSPKLLLSPLSTEYHCGLGARLAGKALKGLATRTVGQENRCCAGGPFRVQEPSRKASGRTMPSGPK